MASRVAAEACGSNVVTIVPAATRSSLQVLGGRSKADVVGGKSKLLRASEKHGKSAVEAEAALGEEGFVAMFGDGRHEKGPSQKTPPRPQGYKRVPTTY